MLAMNGPVPLTIVNLALGHLGHGRVASLDEVTPPAQAARDFLPHIVQEELERFDWGFARAVAALVASEETAPPWRYVWAKPPHCAAIRSVWRVHDDQGEAYARVLAADGLHELICTDVCDVYATYTRDDPAPAVWPATFSGVLGFELAALMAAPLADGPALGMQMKQAAAAIRAQAIAIDSNQNQRRPQPWSDGHLARGVCLGPHGRYDIMRQSMTDRWRI